MREKIVLPAADEVELQARPAPTSDPDRFVPFQAVRGKIPEMADFGSGYHTYVTGLTHNEAGLPATDDAQAHTRLVQRLCDKIVTATAQLTRVELDAQTGAEVGIVSYGISARSAAGAVRLLRHDGLKVSHLRLVTVFPFPEKVVQEFAASLERIVVPEMNLGQICHPVREAVEGAAQVERVAKIGGEIIMPQEIAKAVREHGERV
jgi:2-oxoglutarate ferredoxin oxidoreductase subunit alpha